MASDERRLKHGAKMRTKQINKILRTVKSNRPVFNTYGYIFKVYSGYFMAILDIIPFTFNSFLAIGLKFFTKEKHHLFNIDITKIMECVKKCLN